LDIQQITVIGSGTMGRGIAHVCALAGFETILHDIEEERLVDAKRSIETNLRKSVEKQKLSTADADAALARIQTTVDLESAARGASIIIEAVNEDLDLKKNILAQVDVFCSDGTIIATNTSSFSIKTLADNVERRDRFIGLHFFNPVHIMKLLEIVVGERTSPETIEDAVKLARRIGKEPIIVRDSPGFATSRLGVAIGLEAIRMLEEGVGSAEDIDRAMELGYNHPMGPLRLTDLVGLDVRLSIAEYLASALGPRFEPPALLRRMVEEGKLGKKSGEGFYQWEK
jgi:3-hydroxybutyryl-CoA dehydrogenase